MIDVPKITCQDRLLRRAPLVEPQMPEELVEVPGLSIQDVVLGVVEQIDDWCWYFSGSRQWQAQAFFCW